jgi:hypothetical protein
VLCRLSNDPPRRIILEPSQPRIPKDRLAVLALPLIGTRRSSSSTGLASPASQGLAKPRILSLRPEGLHERRSTARDVQPALSRPPPEGSGSRGRAERRRPWSSPRPAALVTPKGGLSRCHRSPPRRALDGGAGPGRRPDSALQLCTGDPAPRDGIRRPAKAGRFPERTLPTLARIFIGHEDQRRSRIEDRTSAPAINRSIEPLRRETFRTDVGPEHRLASAGPEGLAAGLPAEPYAFTRFATEVAPPARTRALEPFDLKFREPFRQAGHLAETRRPRRSTQPHRTSHV